MILPNLTLSNQEKLGQEVLTHDPQKMKQRQADPLINHVVTIHWVREFLKARTAVFKDIYKIKLPSFFLQADDERVVDKYETERFFKMLSASRKQWKSFPGLYHELLNEVDRQSIMEEIHEWLKEISGR